MSVAAAAGLAACGDGDDEDGQATTDEASEGDIAVLGALLDLEHLAVAVYTAGVRLLTGPAGELGALLRDQEAEHAAGLEQAIRDLGGRPVRARSEREYARMFRDLRDAGDVLRFALDLESTAAAAYIDALPKLQSAELRGTAAAILTSEAEHISVLREELGREPITSAFVDGGAA